MRSPSVLRRPDAEPGVTNMELFFDLVYVFAVTQLSHTLAEHLSVRGAVETLVLFAGVWWAWNYTAWATNWIDPEQLPVRVLLIALMLLSLVMSAAIPEAFKDQGMAFAAAYVAMQLVRAGFMVWAFRGQVMGRNYAQLLAWSALAGAAWIAGALAEGDARLALWILALAIDYGAPLVGFALPGVGRTPMRDWSLSPGHLAERCQLVVIIALGESVLVTGQGFAELERATQTVLAFVVAFLGSAALWWLYFARHAEAAVSRVSQSDDPARLGRGGYAYSHAIMVAGVIVTAVGDDHVIAHPTGSVEAATALTVLGGPAIYLIGMMLFVLTTGGLDRFERIASAGVFALLAVLGLAAQALSPLALAVGATACLIVLVALAALHARDEQEGRPALG
jgi:low temperature requirement protein LtrA